MKTIATRFFFLVLISFLFAAKASAQLSGAIFTTDANGNQVNGNIYNDKCDVYLDGGPGPNAPPTAAGLPDGDYYFQVTDPSGMVLLSTDAVRFRQFRVTGGLITGTSGDGDHATNPDSDQGALGAVVIQLCDFDDTPNPGGVYKVWVTPIEDFVGDPNEVDNDCGNGCFHGFVPADTKTDNFKVKARREKPPCLTVIKFEDVDADGVWDQKGKIYYGRDPEWNWPVTVFGPDGSQINGVRFTPFTLCNLSPGTYTVVEAERDAPDSPFPWVVTANILDDVSLTPPSRTVEVEITNFDRELIFGNHH